jgi:N-acetyl-1-D-myo-inositol-2-amino-2-deoxy-alpha-D-glucopyranoside deacetylase
MPRLLAIVPHPDDEAYSVAGTLTLAARAGWDCTVVAITAGERGQCHADQPATPERLAELRLAELERSCAILGATAGCSPRLPDGDLATHPALLNVVSGALRELAPDLVLTLGPDGAYGHPDHLALHHAAITAVETTPEPPPLLFAVFPVGLFLPQYDLCRPLLGEPPALEPSAVGTTAPDLRIPIRRVAERKLAAIGQHRSQLPGGDPAALFPPGIVPRLLDEEWFDLYRPTDMRLVASLLLAIEAAERGTSWPPPTS